MKIGSKAWVCANCSKDFTSRFSARRYVRVVHRGMGTFDYIIGRTICEYPQIDPSAYKINNRQQNFCATDLASNIENFSLGPVVHSIPRSYENTMRSNQKCSTGGSSQFTIRPYELTRDHCKIVFET